MLYLITGANGAGKTLNTLKWVRERSVKENRPVCHNGRFEPVEGGELSTWKRVDFKDWQNEPDGTIFLIDECHNDLPVRGTSASVPDEVKMLAEHRRRGMDFYLVTQHPQNVDNFVRRLVGSPGWHRHLKRTFGADLVSCIEWDAVNPNCEKSGSGKTGTVTMVGFPKEVYGWYRSASLHTGKKKIPRAVWVLGACALLVPLLGYLAVTTVYGNATKHVAPEAAASASSAPGAGQAGASGRSLTPAEYVEARMPRIPGFPHTAPAYDQVTAPVEAPYPAACVVMRGTCKCYTQQATLLTTADDTCRQIVERGFFVDFKTAQQQPQMRSDEDRFSSLRPQVRGDESKPVQRVVEADYRAPQIERHATVGDVVRAARDGQLPTYSQGLAARNAQVRNALQ